MIRGRHNSQGATPARPRLSVRQVLGELLVIVGALCLLFAFYESFWTNLESGRLQDDKGAHLEDAWAASRDNPRRVIQPEAGDAFAWLTVPAFGSDFRFAVVEGTDDAALQAGPGRYSTTQMPGEAGNFAVAGHRVGKGAPFNDLGRLEVCDELVVETREAVFTYRVLPMDSDPSARRAAAEACLSPGQVDRVAGGDYGGLLGRQITWPSDTSVLEPLPGVPDAAADRAGLESLITLTTCHPQFSNAERMIIHGMLTGVEPKPGAPAPQPAPDVVEPAAEGGE
ncbi:class E sortase [Corynebacterium frankenforstense]|uniref:class E sortase n=1 Tax=Corynebacterium frankenforstense TaxID=1230998 RepID=UPI0009515D70|nr:class E sortase [Corynebacterium frankenforstense]